MSPSDLFHGGDRPRQVMEERLDALFRTGGDVPTRWVPRRLILQNYWLYPYQEFHFGNGRLVLRGPNGSGKTSVLVSAVTLVLDGEKSRSRLDPFRQGGRGIAYYLVGKTETEEGGGGFYHEDRTGYVALELQHGGDGRFLTVGVGMRGRRLSGGGTPRVDSWGFVVRDGRRVGRDRELELTTREGVPLTRTELAERVDAGGVVVERMSDYQAEVNRALFGFPEEEDYAFLVQILLALRSPKLNKELKPSDVADILSESLPPLDPALLERVTQIMDDIDATRADIATTEANHRLVERVHLAVGRHANQVAQGRALDYREKHAAVEEVGDRLIDARTCASAEREEREASRTRLRDADHVRADLQGRLRVLRNHEAYRSRDALTAVERDAARAREHHSGTSTSVREATAAVADSEKRRSGLRDRWTQQRQALLKDVDGLAEAARVAAWPHADQRAADLGARLAALEFGRGEPPELQADALAELASERRARLEQVLEALAGVARAVADSERADSVVQQAQAALRESHDEFRVAGEGVENGRDALGVRLELWRQELRALTVPAQDVATLREQIHRIEDPDGVAPALFGPLVTRASRRRSGLEAERDEARSEASVLEIRRRETRVELEAWEARAEAAPEPRPGQADARARLAAAGVVAVPLYQAVEVREFLPTDKVRPLQSALRESGLLDALVVRPDDVDAVERALGADGGDRWIRPLPLPEGTGTLADILEPSPDELTHADVAAALRSVALGPDGGRGSTRVAADGRWRIGLLEGRAAPPDADAPVYLGREARVRERDLQVARLRSTIRELDERSGTVRDAVRALGERLHDLDEEMEALRGLPEIGALSRALSVRAERNRQVERSNERLQEVERRAGAARRAVGEARQIHDGTVRQAPSARSRDADGVRELISAGDRVVTTAQRVADRLEALRAGGEELDRIMAAMTRQSVALDNARTREREAAEAMAEAEGRLRTVQTDLTELCYEEIMEEVRRAEERQGELDLEGRRLTGDIERLTERLLRTDADVIRLEAERTRCEGERAGARARLAEAIRAYPTLAEAEALFGEGAEGAAGRAADHLLGRRDERPTDLRRRIEDDRNRAWQALTQEVTESRSALIDYHPNLAAETGEVSFRHEGRGLPPHALLVILARHRQQQMSAMREKEDQLYEEFFLQEVSGRIREAIERAEESVERVNALLAERPLANDEILSLRWRPLREIGTDGADHPRLVGLLKKPASVLPPEDVRWIKTFFRDRVRMVREDAAYATPGGAEDHASFAEALRAVLDYRRWFSFTIHGKRPDEAGAEITNREFAARSGGEKSLAMFVPLLAAVDARFRSARPDAPKLVGLDEAFAGVDSDNINEMYAFMVSLDLSWIMTSEKLWGVGAALPACTTYQFHRRGTVAAVQPWLWDGRRNVDEPSLTLSAEDQEEERGSGAA